jgi:hypothetical protein
VSFAAITFCVASQRVFVVVYFVIDSVRELLDTPSYIHNIAQGEATHRKYKRLKLGGGQAYDRSDA